MKVEDALSVLQRNLLVWAFLLTACAPAAIGLFAELRRTLHLEPTEKVARGLFNAFMGTGQLLGLVAILLGLFQDFQEPVTVLYRHYSRQQT